MSASGIQVKSYQHTVQQDGQFAAIKDYEVFKSFFGDFGHIVSLQLNTYYSKIISIECFDGKSIIKI